MTSKQTPIAFVAGFGLAIALTGVAAPFGSTPGAEPTAHDPESDRQAVIAELHRIFDAFVDGDAETLRRTHTDDWIGFKAHSDHIVHGLEDYMSTVSFDNPMLEYDFDELEVYVHGDLAFVWYVATWKNRLTDHDLTMTMTARSLDIYRRHENGWIQAGSHLAVVPKPGALQHMKSDELFEVSFE